MKLRITYNDTSTLDVEVPDESVPRVLEANSRGAWWANGTHGIYINGKDVRSVTPRET